MLVRQCPVLEVLRIYILWEEDVQATVTTSDIRKLEPNSGAIISNLVLRLLREAILFGSEESEPSQTVTQPIDLSTNSLSMLVKLSGFRPLLLTIYHLVDCSPTLPARNS
ncbi:hypothetical protein BDZ89DRAFT_1076394 [Hymenopellis radicata]|nr:hypothetical protein BDZ89DRAFT_1076394 [Hymenopellis radicata]